MRHRFNSKWTKHLPNESDKETLRKTILGSRIALDRLKELLSEELASLENQEASSTDYDSPSWAYKQAHRNGERAFAKKVFELLTFEK